MQGEPICFVRVVAIQSRPLTVVAGSEIKPQSGRCTSVVQVDGTDACGQHGWVAMHAMHHHDGAGPPYAGLFQSCYHIGIPS